MYVQLLTDSGSIDLELSTLIQDRSVNLDTRFRKVPNRHDYSYDTFRWTWNALLTTNILHLTKVGTVHPKLVQKRGKLKRPKIGSMVNSTLTTSTSMH